MTPPQVQKLQIDKELQVIIGSIGAAQAIYLAISSLPGRLDRRQLLLAVFFISITFRILKSLLWISVDTLPAWAMNLGFLAHSLTGPLLYLYILDSFFRSIKPIHVLFHFIPSLFLLGLTFSLPLEGFWYKGGYSMLLFQQMGYVLICVVLLIWQWWKRPVASRLNNTSFIWLSLLLAGAFLFQAAYFSNYVLGLTPYILGPVLYGPLVFTASIFAFRHPEVLRNTSVYKKYRHIHAGEHTLQDCEEKLEEFMAATKPYLSQSCTLPRVAQNIDTPAYLVSHVINARHNKNFPDYINELRIEEAKELLINPDYKQYKIAFIARECGFNSLSAFNAAFKKFTGLTPSRYKERLPDL